MTDEDLQAIRMRAEAATPGPWVKDNDSPIVRGPEMILYDEGGHSDPDADFIAAARTDVPALLAEVDRLRAALGAWETWAAENEALIKGLCTIAHVHGMPYRGKPWPQERLIRTT